MTESTLDGAITDSATDPSVTLNTGGLSAGVNDYILIGSEVLKVTAVTGTSNNDLTVIRAQDGTDAAAHADDAKVYLLSTIVDEQLSFTPAGTEIQHDARPRRTGGSYTTRATHPRRQLHHLLDPGYDRTTASAARPTDPRSSTWRAVTDS